MQPIENLCAPLTHATEEVASVVPEETIHQSVQNNAPILAIHSFFTTPDLIQVLAAFSDGQHRRELLRVNKAIAQSKFNIPQFQHLAFHKQTIKAFIDYFNQCPPHRNLDKPVLRCQQDFETIREIRIPLDRVKTNEFLDPNLSSALWKTLYTCLPGITKCVVNTKDEERLSWLDSVLAEASFLKELELTKKNKRSKVDLEDHQPLSSLPLPLWQCSTLEKLTLKGLTITVLPDAIKELTALRSLVLENLGKLVDLPRNIGYLPQLHHLTLSNLFCLVNIPDSIAQLSNLQTLTLKELSASPPLEAITRLPNLHTLELISLPNTIPVTLPAHLESLPPLLHLILKNCDVEAIGLLFQCTTLRTIELDMLSSPALALPIDLSKLSQLEMLNCRGRFEGNEKIILPSTVTQPARMRTLNLESLLFEGMFDKVIALSQLESLKLSIGWFCLSDVVITNIPDAIGQLSKLSDLELGGFDQLTALPETIGNLSQLRSLKLSDLPLLALLPEAIGNLLQLENLELSDLAQLTLLPNSIGQLSTLRQLQLTNLPEFKALPDCLGNLLQLENLTISDMPLLETLPETIGELTALTSLCLNNLFSLTALPTELGKLTQLTSFSCNRLKDDNLVIPEKVRQLPVLK